MTKGIKITLGVLIPLLVCLFIYFFIAFRGSEEHLKHIPEKSLIVGVLDLKSLSTKVADFPLHLFTGLKTSSLTQFQAPLLQAILKSQGNTGVDIFSNIYFFVHYSPAESYATGLVIHLSEQKELEKLLELAYPNTQLKNGEGFHFIAPAANYGIGWSNNTLLAIRLSDSLMSVEKTFNRLFHQEEKNSILANKKFIQLQQETADIKAFLNYEALAVLPVKNPWLAAFYHKKHKDALHQSYGIANVNLEANRMHLQLKNYFSRPDLMDSLSYFSHQGLSNEVANSICAQHPYAALSCTFKPKKVWQQLQSNPFLLFGLNSLKFKYGLLDVDLGELTGGELCYSVPGVVVADTLSNSQNSLIHQFFLSTQNPVLLKRVLEKSCSKTSIENLYSFPWSGRSYAIAAQHHGVYLSRYPVFMEQLLNGNAHKPAVPGKLNELICKNPLVCYLQLNNALLPAAARQAIYTSFGAGENGVFKKLLENSAYFLAWGNLKTIEAEWVQQ